MPSDKISTARISQPSTPQKSSEIAVKTAEKKMPLLTLDPNKPKLAPVGVMGTRSPHKRGTTPPQSPPTPHKIELIEDSDCHRKLRSSTSSDSGSSSSSSTSSEEGLTVKNLEFKKNLFGTTNGTSLNGTSIKTTIRTSPRKTEHVDNNHSVKLTINLPKEDKGPKKKLSFVNGDKSSNNSVKAFMPIRRSERRPKKNQTADIIQKLQNIGNDDSRLPLEIRDIPEKNRGVVPTKKLSKGDFVVEYAGELIEHTTAEERENKYAMDVSKGCYMYYFKTNGKHYCIDATVETGRYGRLVNHSRLHPNLMTKVIMNGKSPRLILVAKHDIEPGTELLYDYGDRSKESLAAHPWLAK